MEPGLSGRCIFEVDLSKWRLEERKDFSGYSHEKIYKRNLQQAGIAMKKKIGKMRGVHASDVCIVSDSV